MTMDPDSPFAGVGAGSQKIQRYGFSHTGIIACQSCKHEWLAPVENGGAAVSVCPKCRGSELILKDDSVKPTPPARK